MNFYKSTALALDHLDRHQGSVKGSVNAAGIKTASGGETKRVLALVIETLKYRPVLQQLLEIVPLLSLEKLTFPRKTPPKTPSSKSLVLVLLHDLLFSSRARVEASDKWAPKQAILKHQARLKAELVRVQIREGKKSKADLARVGTEGVARYVRWNPNTDLHQSGDRSLDALFRHLQSKGFKQLEEAVYPVPENSFFLDPHLSDCLLVFPAETNWWVGDEWYKSGAIVLQEKASCFPAKVLMEGWAKGEGECLDATAAPGNKTSYISALMGDTGVLYAFERSAGRFTTLEKMLNRASCKNVKAQCADFLNSDPRGSEYTNVTRILLDPSCSGSGIVNRLDYLLEENDAQETDAKAERLEKLAGFQLQMILHAFKFPAAKRIVYSTCSIHAEEDEQVVMKALTSPTAKDMGWIIAPKSQVLPTWDRRGRVDEMGGDQNLANSVIRCVPGEDKTNGFFVACFVKNISSSVTSVKFQSAGRKRPLDAEEDDKEDLLDVYSDAKDETHETEQDVRVAKNKTAAQLARKKRKKQQQKSRQ